jgi:hypothetical protein
MSQQQYYPLNEAAQFLSKELDDSFDTNRLFSLAEQGLIAIGVRVNPSNADIMYSEGIPPPKKTLYLKHNDILKLSPHSGNENKLKTATAFTNPSYVNSLNRRNANGNESIDSSSLNDETFKQLLLYDVKRRELLITRLELLRYIEDLSLNYFYVVSDFAKTFKALPYEVAMWAYADNQYLQPYADQKLLRTIEIKNCINDTIELRHCFFSREQAEAFNPQHLRHSGRWLKYEKLISQWKSNGFAKSEESLFSLILSKHSEAVTNGNFAFFPNIPNDSLFAIHPHTGFAKDPREGMYQENQIESFEKEYLSKWTESQYLHPVGYQEAFALLNLKSDCTKETFTMLVKWENFHAYKDQKLTKRIAVHSNNFDSVPNAFRGAYFNKDAISSIDTEKLDDHIRAINYSEVVRRIVEASGLSVEDAKEEIRIRFDTEIESISKDKDDIAFLSPIEGSTTIAAIWNGDSTLGMMWLGRFKNPCPENAAYAERYVDNYISSQFCGNPIKRQVQYYYLEDASEHLTHKLNIPHSIGTLFSLAEQGQLGIGFKRPTPDWEFFNPRYKNIPTAPNLFIDEHDIKRLSPNGQNLEVCTSTTSHPNEETANDFNYAHFIKDGSVTEKYRLQRADEHIVSKEIARKELFITHHEMKRYISNKKYQAPGFEYKSHSTLNSKLKDILDDDGFLSNTVRKVESQTDGNFSSGLPNDFHELPKSTRIGKSDLLQENIYEGVIKLLDHKKNSIHTLKHSDVWDELINNSSRYSAIISIDNELISWENTKGTKSTLKKRSFITRFKTMRDGLKAYIEQSRTI